MTKNIVLLLFISSSLVYSQSNKCELIKNSDNLYEVNKNDVFCLSKNSNELTLIYSFGIWCKPCIAHLPNALKLRDDYDLNLYILLIEKKGSENAKIAIDYLNEQYENIQIIFIKDEYGNSKNRRYKNFLKDITPTNFENINDMSKYILINKEGEVIMVTNYKDNLDNSNWKDDSKMIEKKIIPLLNKK